MQIYVIVKNYTISGLGCQMLFFTRRSSLSDSHEGDIFMLRLAVPLQIIGADFKQVG